MSDDPTYHGGDCECGCWASLEEGRPCSLDEWPIESHLNGRRRCPVVRKGWRDVPSVHYRQCRNEPMKDDRFDHCYAHSSPAERDLARSMGILDSVASRGTRRSTAKLGKPVSDASDIVNQPAHYTFGSVEVIDAIEAWELGFHLGNAVKYIARAGRKDPAKKTEDLRKARWYLDREINNQEGDYQ